MRNLSAALFFLVAFVPTAKAQASSSASYGILLLAHGGTKTWNKQVQDLAKAADKNTPTELALGMADADSIQQAVDRLEKRGVPKIVAVPLFINSSSELMDQTRFVLGARQEPSAVFVKAMSAMPMGESMPGMSSMSFSKQVQAKVPLVVADALDDSPAVAGILTKRALSLGKNPKNETLVLVGHGPVDDAANAVWLKTMESLASQIKSRAAFKRVEIATLRDDSPEAVKAAAAKALRDIVQRSAKDGEVLVVPDLVSSGDIQIHIRAALKGLAYRWNGKALCPDPEINRWVLDTAAKYHD